MWCDSIIAIVLQLRNFGEREEAEDFWEYSIKAAKFSTNNHGNVFFLYSFQSLLQGSVNGTQGGIDRFLGAFLQEKGPALPMRKFKKNKWKCLSGAQIDTITSKLESMGLGKLVEVKNEKIFYKCPPRQVTAAMLQGTKLLHSRYTEAFRSPCVRPDLMCQSPFQQEEQPEQPGRAVQAGRPTWNNNFRQSSPKTAQAALKPARRPMPETSRKTCHQARAEPPRGKRCHEDAGATRRSLPKRRRRSGSEEPEDGELPPTQMDPTGYYSEGEKETDYDFERDYYGEY